ncbi:unnamed protein product [Diamesa hyperborea]
MVKFSCLSLVIFCAVFVRLGSAKNEQCSTLACIHASATMIELLDEDFKPCEDFYGYACGNFDIEIRSADEETTINTLATVDNNVAEYLFNLLIKDPSDKEKKLHTLSKKFYKSCEKAETVNGRNKQPLLDILNEMNVFPMLNGTWDDKNWDWKESLLKLRTFISNKTDDIFKSKKEQDKENLITRGYTEDELAKIKEQLGPLMMNVVRELGGPTNATDLLKTDIQDLVLFEEKLADFYNKQKAVNRTGPNFKKVPGFVKVHKRVLWMELFSPSYLTIAQQYNETLENNLTESYDIFIKKTPPRVLANYVGWRVIQASIDFMHIELRNEYLKFQKKAFGKEDVDQRWKLCVVLTQNVPAVATGSLYIDEYFKEDDKKAAVELVNDLIAEYSSSIEESVWMDDQTKTAANDTAMKMKRYIGYEDQLRTKEAYEFYNDLEEYPEEKFLEMGLAFKIFETDREYTRLIGNMMNDWTKYSKPATVNAFYKSEDNSIQFPAAILQSPTFDSGRPKVMNFGAIGSIIGHEITHAFDNLAEKKEGWSSNGIEEYEKKVQCIKNQYNEYHVAIVERDFKTDNFTIDGALTLKENIADCGGVKLAYDTFKKWEKIHKPSKPIAMEEFSNDQIFWISFAQTKCSIENSALLKKQKEKNIYAPDRFRVVGPIHNMPEFATAFNCPADSPMNRALVNRCELL